MGVHGALCPGLKGYVGVHGALCPGLKGYVGVHGVLCPGLKGYVGVHGVLWGSTRNKSQMAPNEKVCFYEKLGLRSKHRVKVICLIVEIKFLQKV